MSVTTPEDLARKLASDGVACTDADLASRLLTDLRHAQAMGSPSSPEPLEVFARAGGVAALAAAMKANTPVAADWPEGMCPASGVDLAEVREDLTLTQLTLAPTLTLSLTLTLTLTLSLTPTLTRCRRRAAAC